MTDVTNRYNALVRKTFDMLYSLCEGQKKTHSDLIKQAQLLLPITAGIQDVNQLPEYNDILKSIIDLYEIEVGIKTYAPNVLAADRQSKYWLYKLKGTTPRPFFDRYKLYLRQDGFDRKTIDNIEASCEEVLAYCANPRSQADKKRGLVVGDVQSGKTANYLGLINLAYDYGYKIVVLLAGTTNSLRVQTQKRTDKGVIGAKSDSIGNLIEYIGVGFSAHEHYAVPFTNQNNDFAKFIQKNLNATIADYNKPVVLVVKKNKSILESVSERLQSELSEQGLDSKSILIIDDEADNASLNTNKPEKDPTAINRCIRAIFNKFPIASYVGYTATPFANIFINPDDKDPANLDLFPSDFIVQLNAPSTYWGGRVVFPGNSETLPLCLREIKEDEPYFLPVIHDKYVEYLGLADSMKEAIHSFLINNVIRTLRGQKIKHRSMMINITRYNDVQAQIQEYVSTYIEILTNEIEQLSSGPVECFIANKNMKAIFDLFTKDSFYTAIREGDNSKEYLPITWEQIQNGLYSEIKQVSVVVINSKNGKMSVKDGGKSKRFDYEDYDTTGARVIAIGGMVLSRGLTLEGLMISYYSRNAGAYDTLLQMCRWFGYRPKYEDLCRVYLTQENIDRFDAVLDAVDDLRQQFEEMERQDKKPKDFGLMVKESPDTLDTTLLVTARNKMRASEVIEYHLNYGGVYADTSKLLRDAAVNRHNRDAFNSFAAKLDIKETNGRYIASSVSKFYVAEFIRNLKISYVNRKFDTEGLSAYIENSEVFQEWDVVIATGDSTNLPFSVGHMQLKPAIRSFHVKNAGDTYIRIGGSNNRVMEPGILNAGLWLTEGDREHILKEKNAQSKNGKQYTSLGANDYLRYRVNPILVIYPIDLSCDNTASEKKQLSLYEQEKVAALKAQIKQDVGNNREPLLAFAIGFPKKESGVMVTYRANRIKLDEINANMEIDDDGEGEEDYDD